MSAPTPGEMAERMRRSATSAGLRRQRDREDIADLLLAVFENDEEDGDGQHA